jgi:hypothetical protein
VHPNDWLRQTIAFHRNNADNDNETVDIPTTDDGKDYTIEMLKTDQLHVFVTVMSKIKEFIETDDLSRFKPLRAILNGFGGSGKSLVTNTIVAYLRKMFMYNNVAKVAAPTGTAAFNVGGETLHRLFGIKVSHDEYDDSHQTVKKRQDLIRKFKCLMCLIIDERSLLQSKDLGAAEQVLQDYIYGGGPLSTESWGGVPVVLLVGDDFQLKGVGEGALAALSSTSGGKMTHKGRQALLTCADFVMELSTSKRLNQASMDQADLMSRLRMGRDITEADVSKLLSLHLREMELKHGKEFIDEIDKEAIYLFYTNEKRIRHNLIMLGKQSQKDTPVAMIKPRCTSACAAKAISRHFDSETPLTTFMTIGSKVALDRNFEPLWGLHNGACGTIEEIVYEKGHSPNNGQLPSYVVVQFPLYCGPSWDKDSPKSVPIPMSELICNKGCCCRRYLPLDLAYARTIHKFQGLTAGPTDPGKPQNMYKCIVCDPDEKKWEGTALGLLYTAVSRATTLGDENGLNSGIYFTGSDFKAHRIYNLYKKQNSIDEFELAQKRAAWVEHIKKNTVKIKRPQRQIKAVAQWCSTHKSNFDELDHRIEQYIDSRKKTTSNKRKRD